MNPKNKQKRSTVNKILLLVLLISISFSSPAHAQTGQKLLLSFRSSLSMEGVSAYGPAGIEIKSEGFAYLNPEKGGTFSGTGEIYVTMNFKYSPNPAMSISPLKGQGPLIAKGRKKGKYLNFWFEHAKIPCKGIITVNYPPPMGTEKKEYVDDFDPNTLAQRSTDDMFTLFDIELKDGAEKVVDYSSMSANTAPQTFSGKTTFYLDGIESWRVSVNGEETDSLQPPIDNPRLKAKIGELPITMRFTWNLIAEFSTLGQGPSRRYYDGDVFSSILDHGLVFQHEDLYSCSEKECEGSQDLDIDFTGEKINGKVSGNTVQLQWPHHVPLTCVTCVPRNLGNLGEKIYNRTFKSSEFLFSLSSEKIPLEDGKVINRSKGDWMKYKITLTKLK